MSGLGAGWLWLLAAGLFEIVWAVGLKSTAGFSRLLPSCLVVAAMVVSFIFLSQALRTLPIGTAYAVWTGIGAAGTALVSGLFFGESFSGLKCLSLFFVIAGVVGLRIFSD